MHNLLKKDRNTPGNLPTADLSKRRGFIPAEDSSGRQKGREKPTEAEEIKNKLRKSASRKLPRFRLVVFICCGF